MDLFSSELPFAFSTNMRIADQQKCDQIDKLCLEMVAGTVMPDQSLGPREAIIRCHHIEVDCSGGITVTLGFIHIHANALFPLTPLKPDPDSHADSCTWQLKLESESAQWKSCTLLQFESISESGD